MSVVEGIGTCLIPQDSGVPCGSQIEQGEPIRTLHLPFGGAVVGHKKCVDAYEARKREDDEMVKRVDQSGPGGSVDMDKATDALVGSIPLEQSPGKHEKKAEDTPSWGEGVRPVAEVPLGSPPPEANLPALGSPPPEFLTVTGGSEYGLSADDLGTSDEQVKLITSTTELIAILAKFGVGLDPQLLAELLIWKRKG